MNNSLLNCCFRDLSPMDRAFFDLVDKFFTRESERVNQTIGETAAEKYDHYVKSDGGYKCIHLRVALFIQQLNDVVKHLNLTPEQISNMKFLDVGCGVGQKIFLANCFGFRARGLELRKELISAGQNLFSDLRVEIRHDGYYSPEPFFIHGDALTYDGYNDFDILYFYCPLMAENLEIKLEEKLAKDAKPGAIVLANLPKHFLVRKTPEGWKRYGDDFDRLIFQKL